MDHGRKRRAGSVAALITSATLALPLGTCGENAEPDAPAEPSGAEPSTQPSAQPDTRPRAGLPGTIVDDPSILELPDTCETFEPGQELWAVYPDDSPQSWTFGKVRCEQQHGRNFTATVAGGTREAPCAFARAALPAEGLVPGLPVTVAAGGLTRLGRVQSISGDSIRVRYSTDHGATEDATVSPTDVRPFRSRALEPGAPVLFSGGDASFIGTLATVTGERAYVVCGGLIELARTRITPLDLTKLLKPGDRVLAVPPDAGGCAASEGEVIEMRDDGLRYAVKLADGEEILAPFGLVALHPSAPRPKAP